MDFYFTLETTGSAAYKDRGSKFLAYCYPLQTAEEFKKHLQAIKKEHPKAAHYCFAYRIGFDGNNHRASDDGEPSGTAGKQILGQLDSKNITNALVIVIRYFGGTLLGVPGLINAYKTATSLALQCTQIVQKPVEIKYSIHFDYTILNDVMHILKQFKCTIHKNEMQLFCDIEAGIPKTNLHYVTDALENIPNVKFKKLG
ncbi:MAG: YigZ family protein [Ginsengibacter sp.]